MTSRAPHQPCTRHRRPYCSDTTCKAEESNVGTVCITTEGTPAIGIGAGLAIDPTDGSIGFQIAPGIVVDTA